MCENRKAIDDLIANLNGKFKTRFNKLSVCKGKVHNYLGINIDYVNKYYIKFIMYNLIQAVLKEARKDMNGLLPWPASDKLFDINHESPHLNEADVDYFHRMTEQFLFVCKRERPNIKVAVVFLCTRVKEPTEEDYKKLARSIKYLRNTVHLLFLIGWDESGV